MTRKYRTASTTGVYHVMLRGNNKQDIFECNEDYLRFLTILQQKCYPQDNEHNPLTPCCVLYSYCLMSNHVHLLIQEKEECLSDLIKGITISYAQYYNLKYDHTGHLFQGRFRSEPVNDLIYFQTLIRYIHQNPIAGGLVKRAEDYEWSSWREFLNKLCYIKLCPIGQILSRIPLQTLKELVDEPMPKAQRILDINNESPFRLSDEIIRDFILFDCGVEHIKDIQSYSKPQKAAILEKIHAFGASYRQIARITGISESLIRRILKK